MDKDEIGMRLQRARERRGLSLEEAGRRARPPISKSEMSRLENGKTGDLPLGKLDRWTGALGIRVELALWDGEEDQTGLVELAAKMDPDDAGLLRSLAEVLPHLKPEERETLADVVRGWRRRRAS